MTFPAIPYFADATTPADSRLSYRWEINKSPVQASTTNASEITINANNSSGGADLSLKVTSPFNFYLQAEHTWNLVFSRRGALPSTALDANDAFHTSTQ